jgi:acetate kinase
MQKEEIDLQTANTLINKHSGMLGITGISSDMREIEAAKEKNDERSILGLQMYNYRIRKYIGAYSAVMGGLDVVVFTGGVGENSPSTRLEVCKNFEYLGLQFDENKNKGLRAKEAIISQDSSKVTVMVVPTNEELMIAEDTERIVQLIKK